MTDNGRRAGLPAPHDDDRLADWRRLTAEIRALLQDMVQHARENPLGIKPADLLKKIGELQSAELKVLEKEGAYHDKLAENRAETIDYDAIRAEIGRKLDRIRAARDAESVSGGPE